MIRKPIILTHQSGISEEKLQAAQKLRDFLNGAGADQFTEEEVEKDVLRAIQEVRLDRRRKQIKQN